MIRPAPDDHDERNHPVKRGYDPAFMVSIAFGCLLVLIGAGRLLYLFFTRT